MKLARAAFVAVLFFIMLNITFLIVSGAAYGSVIVVPSDAQTAEGSSSGYFGTDEGIVAQELYEPADMPSLAVGDVITGFSLRLDGSDSSEYPTSPVTWSEFNISVGQGNSSLTMTFANNFASTPTVVRSGSLDMSAGFFPLTGTPGPEPFGTEIPFTTPYTYTGGNLLIQVNDVSPNQLLVIDAMGSPTGPPSSQTSGQSLFNAGSASATTSNEGPFSTYNWAMQLDVAPVPEPSSLLLLATGMLGIAGHYWRRTKRGVY